MPYWSDYGKEKTVRYLIPLLITVPFYGMVDTHVSTLIYVSVLVLGPT